MATFRRTAPLSTALRFVRVFRGWPNRWGRGSKPARKSLRVVVSVNRAEFFDLPVCSFDLPFRPLAHSPFATPRVQPPNRIARPLSNASVLNRWFGQNRHLSLSPMRPQQAQAASSIVPAREPSRQSRAGRPNWLHIVLAAVGIASGSSVAGVLVYDWYFDSAIVGLSSSLQPFSDAFHELGGSHLRQAPSQGD